MTDMIRNRYEAPSSREVKLNSDRHFLESSGVLNYGKPGWAGSDNEYDDEDIIF